MIAVWKFTLEKAGLPERIEMPEDVTLLRVGVDGRGEPCVWARVDTDSMPRGRMFVAYGTGHEMQYDHGEYVGSFELHETMLGWLIFHVFDLGWEKQRA